jgi:DNA-binding NarL/FixJ family response regulator
MKMKIVIIDDHQIIREGLNALFKNNEFFEVVADFDNEEELFFYLNSHETHLILMDLHLRSANGLELTKRAKMEYPQIKVVMHTMSNNMNHLEEARRIGADGYVLKSGGQKELEAALVKVLAGHKYYQSN